MKVKELKDMLNKVHDEEAEIFFNVAFEDNEKYIWEANLELRDNEINDRSDVDEPCFITFQLYSDYLGDYHAAAYVETMDFLTNTLATLYNRHRDF